MKYIPLFLLLFLNSCSNPREFQDFDQVAWQNDKMACKGDRAELLPNLLKQQTKLIGLSQNDLILALGKPDHQELYKRNQKFYIYYIDEDITCNQNSDKKNRRMLKIRISPIGLTNEVSIYSNKN